METKESPVLWKKKIDPLQGEFKGSVLIWNNVYSQASSVVFQLMVQGIQLPCSHCMYVCAKVCVTSDNFLTKEYWVLTCLCIWVSVQWAQQEKLKVGQSQPSRSWLLHSFWNVCVWLMWVCVWPQLNCKCRARTTAISAIIVHRYLSDASSNLWCDFFFFLSSYLQKDVLERNCGTVLCPVPTWLWKDGVNWC